MAKLKDFKNEIKVLDIAALVSKAKALKIEISDLVLDKNMNKLKDLKSISKKKKELARVLTVLSQKEMIGKLEGKEEKKEEKKAKEKEGNK
jgi:ribosomal protein L29